jgi:hypothetical protein
VAYQLAGSGAGRGNAHTVYDVVEAAFEQLHEVLAGSAFQAGSFHVGVTELLLEHHVGVLRLLLFTELDGVLGLRFALLGVAVLAGRKAVLVEVLAGSEDRLAELAADSVFWSCITCQVAILN